MILTRPGSGPLAEPVAMEAPRLAVEVLGGPMDGWRCQTRRPFLRIGRGEDNDLRLALDPMVSSRHARLVREGRHFWLEDLASRNGTWMGDLRVEGRVLLAAGATFTVGQTLLEFRPC